MSLINFYKKIYQMNFILLHKTNTAKPLYSGHLRVLTNLSVKTCPLLGRNLKEIVKFGTKYFVRYSRHVRCSGCPLLADFHCIKIRNMLIDRF